MFVRLQTKGKIEVVNITREIQQICRNSGIKEGFALIFPHHTSSAVYISDSDPNLTQDFNRILSKLIPYGDDYLHDLSDYKRNADAHLKASLTGHHVILPITDGRLDLGIYQTIYYAEFDGQREKEILVKIIGE
jgi:secondary thiamine-phosphate synthase enzyme